MPHRRKKKVVRKVGGRAPAQRGQVVRQGTVTRQGPVTPRRVPGTATPRVVDRTTTGGGIHGVARREAKRRKAVVARQRGGTKSGTVVTARQPGVRTISGTVTKAGVAPRKKKVARKRSRRRSY